MPSVTKSKYKNVFKYLLNFKQVKQLYTFCWAGMLLKAPQTSGDLAFILVSPSCPIILQLVSFPASCLPTWDRKYRVVFFPKCSATQGQIKFAVCWPSHFIDRTTLRENSIAFKFPSWKSPFTICWQAHQRKLQDLPLWAALPSTWNHSCPWTRSPPRQRMHLQSHCSLTTIFTMLQYKHEANQPPSAHATDLTPERVISTAISYSRKDAGCSTVNTCTTENLPSIRLLPEQ